MIYFKENYYFPRFQRGQHFQGGMGVQHFPRGGGNICYGGGNFFKVCVWGGGVGLNANLYTL